MCRSAHLPAVQAAIDQKSYCGPPAGPTLCNSGRFQPGRAAAAVALGLGLGIGTVHQGQITENIESSLLKGHLAFPGKIVGLCCHR